MFLQEGSGAAKKPPRPATQERPSVHQSLRLAASSRRDGAGTAKLDDLTPAEREWGLGFAAAGRARRRSAAHRLW